MPPKKSHKVTARQGQPNKRVKRKSTRIPNIPSGVSIAPAQNQDRDTDDIDDFAVEAIVASRDAVALENASRVARRERVNATALATASLRNELTRIFIVMGIIILALIVLKATNFVAN